MESKAFVRSKLVNYTTADCSDVEVKNNRYHYFLRFEESIGWTWLYSQICKLDAELDVDIELWKIRPSGVKDFEIEVREIGQRENIDDSQRGLTEFES